MDKIDKALWCIGVIVVILAGFALINVYVPSPFVLLAIFVFRGFIVFWEDSRKKRASCAVPAQTSELV